MANEQNLKPQAHVLTVEEQKRGGIASAESRRAKKNRRELALEIANAKITDEKLKKRIKKMTGLDDEDITGDAGVVNAIYTQALCGNVKAFDRWEQLTAEKSTDNKEYLLPAKVIGESFVKINRQIQPNMTYIFEGGRGSTKSSFISLKIIELLKNNPNMHACIVRKVAGTLRDSVYAQMLWAISELDLNDEFENTVAPLEITYKKTKQKIYFRGCDDPIKLKGIKTTFGYVGILWKEEKDQLAGEEEERNVNQSVLRGGDKSYDFSSYNPPKSKSNWVNKAKNVPNKDRVIHHSTYETVDKEWLGTKFIADAEHLKDINPEAYEHEYLGVPNGSGGNVFEYLEIRKITDEEIKTFDRIFSGVDFGWYPDIYAYKRLYIDQARRKIYHIAEITGNKMSNKQTAQLIIDAGFDDYIITCDSAEPKSINDYRDMGLPVRGAVKGAGSVEYGMKFLQGYTHVIDPERTPVTYKEYTEYEYDRDKEGNVISGYPDKNNHTIDADRYALESYYNKRGNSA